MMSSGGRRSFRRPEGQRRYRKLFVIVAEGTKTEPQYFSIFDRGSIIHVKCLRGDKGNSPAQVLARMERFLKEEPLRKGDEAWMVVDKDQWTEAQLRQLQEWTQGHSQRGFAVSNPSFEYWLLLHFEDGDGQVSQASCLQRLRRYLPDYNKGIDTRRMTPDRIDDAVRRARSRDTPPCDGWPTTTGTTVYRLVERLKAG